MPDSKRSEENDHGAMTGPFWDGLRVAGARVRARMEAEGPAFSSQSEANLKELSEAYLAGGKEALKAKFDEIFPPDDPRYK